MRQALSRMPDDNCFHGTDLLTLEICETVDSFICTHNTESLICHTKQMITAVRINITDQTVEFRIIDFLRQSSRESNTHGRSKTARSLMKETCGAVFCTTNGISPSEQVSRRSRSPSERGVCVYLNFHFCHHLSRKLPQRIFSAKICVTVSSGLAVASGQE